MTEETPGFDEKPDVPSGATPDDAEPQAATPSTEEAAAPAGDASAAQMAGLTAQLDQVRTALGERTMDLQQLPGRSTRTTAAGSSATGSRSRRSPSRTS